MKLEKLRDVMHAAPFLPFTIYVADGTSLRVPHPDYIAIMGNGRTAVVTSPIEQSPSYLIVDVPMITQLDIHGAQPNGADQ